MTDTLEQASRPGAAMRRFENQTVLVTGAAGGLGAATARRLASEGARVLLTDLAQDALAGLARELGASAAFRAADLADERSIAALFEWALGQPGGLDHLVNNAGIVTKGRLESFSDADWARVMNINLTALYRTTKLFAADRIRRGRPGAIVNLASMSYKGMTQQVAYAASKGGVVSLTKSTALELARHGVRANAVAPGMIETAMTAPEDGSQDSLRQRMIASTPLKRYGRPEEVAAAIAFLLSDDAAYVTGEVLHVAGGARL